MHKNMTGRVGPWILGALFGILILELVLMAPEALDHFEADDWEAAVETQPAPSTSAAQTMVGINVVETRDQQKEWELWSDRAVSVYGEGDLDLENVKIRFFGSDGVDFLVKGERGLVEAGTKNMQIQGEVTMTTSNGYIFSTDNMTYNSSVRVLRGQSAVKVLGPALPAQLSRLRIFGIGMEVDLQGEEMRILSSVKASRGLPQNRGGELNIESGAALLSSKDQSISFSKEVKMRVQDTSVSGPKARFVYNEAGNQLQAIEMDGGVRVSDWNKWATAEQVRVDLIKNHYVFKGAPRVVQDADELFGDEIVFIDGGKRVKVKNARIKVSRERLEGEK